MLEVLLMFLWKVFASDMFMFRSIALLVLLLFAASISVYVSASASVVSAEGFSI